MQDIFLKSLIKFIPAVCPAADWMPRQSVYRGGDFGSFVPCFSLNRAVRVS